MADNEPGKDRRGARKPLGQRLLESGLINQGQLDLALREQKRLGIYLGDALENLGFASPEVVTAVLAEETQSELVDVVHRAIDPDLLKLAPYEMAKKYLFIPLSRDGGTLTIAMADTFNVVAVDAVEQATGLSVNVAAAPEQSIIEAIERHYGSGASLEETVDMILREGIDAQSEAVTEEAPMIRLVDQIITQGIKRGATDIHVEPDESFVRIRMRVDGMLSQEALLPKPLQPAVTARLKIMASLNIAEKRAPQDGRFTFTFGQRGVDLRVSTMPTSFGENVVIRILDTSSMPLEFAALGFSESNESLIRSALANSHGVILVTGPTGSGKTTTLYAALNELNDEKKSIYTLEDPVEYRLPSIRQTQVQPEAGMTFAAGLRAVLRQDPDVILVGEIRDTETAELAVRAALTGHLVFSTLHTSDAIGVVARLIDMGIERFLLPSVLTTIVAQRLVRLICVRCKVEIPNPESVIGALDADVRLKAPAKLWRGEGCGACAGSGYHGRTGIFEVLNIDDRFHDPIVNGADARELGRLVREAGMRTMLEDGLEKAYAGKTTVEEVFRVIK